MARSFLCGAISTAFETKRLQWGRTSADLDLPPVLFPDCIFRARSVKSSLGKRLPLPPVMWTTAFTIQYTAPKIVFPADYNNFLQ